PIEGQCALVVPIAAQLVRLADQLFGLGGIAAVGGGRRSSAGGDDQPGRDREERQRAPAGPDGTGPHGAAAATLAGPFALPVESEVAAVCHRVTSNVVFAERGSKSR